MPQQHRAQLTRHSILVAAAAEIDQVGYEAARLSAILRRCKTTKGAFYFHFSGKQDVAQVLVEHYRERLSELSDQWYQRAQDPLATMVGLTCDTARHLEEDVQLRAGLLLACNHVGTDTDGWEFLFDDLIRRAADRGLLRPGVDPAAMARLCYAVVVGTNLLVSGDPRRLAARLEESWRVLLPGLVADGDRMTAAAG
ncbi:TetR/AcrR family transcriptional regulator [Saccharopolyspora mangrovi]|uniref:TetR/AcrR family transcriptional regulator n=1 Tax=Saccharopolyspora mangrovi TaxID=3082379 RepID=A0ABU6AFS9_9PSEU|nr:TetR/AcrR family transcriptional regulator [Saccharopolyspora sp. S2-29]MEB3370244.1 TetR/AcrR family transcriptional regulator [Saccharopolyspora sp. S2-29]